MGVVPAGMHLSGITGPVGDIILLLHGQRVHICAQEDCLFMILTGNKGSDSGFQ